MVIGTHLGVILSWPSWQGTLKLIEFGFQPTSPFLQNTVLLSESLIALQYLLVLGFCS